MKSSRLRVVATFFHLLPWLVLAASLAWKLGSLPIDRALVDMAKPLLLVGALTSFHLIVARAHTGRDYRARMARATVVGAENFMALMAFIETLHGPYPSWRRATAWLAATAIIGALLLLRAATANRAVAKEDERAWVWGVFYRNAADRALWVE
ncbi:MAG TPA: hypothetical protein VK550_28220, partial [Polyangiaceae bacterium]|nr:hypothetical protein [Polyangiaceae bacterium]